MPSIWLPIKVSIHVLEDYCLRFKSDIIQKESSTQSRGRTSTPASFSNNKLMSYHALKVCSHCRLAWTVSPTRYPVMSSQPRPSGSARILFLSSLANSQMHAPPARYTMFPFRKYISCEFCFVINTLYVWKETIQSRFWRALSKSYAPFDSEMRVFVFVLIELLRHLSSFYWLWAVDGPMIRSIKSNRPVYEVAAVALLRPVHINLDHHRHNRPVILTDIHILRCHVQ
ncbi:hypothetical protein F5148DRAFT_308385 [Russula earlei]|uniref:Uncharacterized protein n=1 Tax=Russula earlei TaxID=71964 RepID=A0ACC0U2C0_9AGAM|nr:hypothetical protein F5148DRAFT_308385 [Russula earlei]